MSTNSIFYVYQYVTPENVPYYVGKGKGKRIHAMHKHTIVPAKEFRIFVKTGLTEDEAIDLEIELIKFYGRKVDSGLLDNTKLNQWACTSGWTHSAETKAKISKSKLGVKKSDETREKMRQAQLNQSEETRHKIRLANLGRPNDGRYLKIGQTKSKQRWYNNGIITRMYVPGQEEPGFVAGRKIG